MERNINAQRLDVKATLREIFLLLLFICLRHTTIHSAEKKALKSNA